MEPTFHTGDLALVRPSDDYEVGQVVAYRSRDLQTLVLHRIVGRVGGRYLVKGDNHTGLDREQPAAGDIVGRVWLHVPAVGGALHAFRNPVGLTSLAGVLFLFAWCGAGVGRRRRQGLVLPIDRRA